MHIAASPSMAAWAPTLAVRPRFAAVQMKATDLTDVAIKDLDQIKEQANGRADLNRAFAPGTPGAVAVDDPLEVCEVVEECEVVEVCESDDATLGEECKQQEVCVEEEVCEPVPPGFTFDYLWPRGLLLFSSILYGTNFPLGRIMNEVLPPSAATSSRLLFAAITLSPFLFQLKPSIRWSALLCGCFTALGYVTQSIALVDTPAATVAFLGALTVLVCPLLAVVVDKKKLGLADAPQVWLAATLALAGVGVLELGGAETAVSFHWGDAWSVLQAIGFGTSFFLTERMMAKEPSQALPITAAQCGVSALVAGTWAFLDGGAFWEPGSGAWVAEHTGWLQNPNFAATFALPGLLTSHGIPGDVMSGDLPSPDWAVSMGWAWVPSIVALAALWTGLVTTAANRCLESIALGKVSSAEASVLLATEPLWAALFAALYIEESLDARGWAGGALLVGACLANAIEPQQLRGLIPGLGGKDEAEELEKEMAKMGAVPIEITPAAEMKGVVAKVD